MIAWNLRVLEKRLLGLKIIELLLLLGYGGPAAIRTQDLTVISRALHQAKLRAHKSILLNYRSWKAFFEGTPWSDNTFNTRITTYNFCLKIRYFADPKIYLQDAEPASTVLYTILSVWGSADKHISY